MATLVAVDYIVIALMLFISSGIGVYYWWTARQKTTTEEYFMASRSMSVTPVAIGLMTSFMSSVSLLGVSSEIYVYGTQYFVIVVSYCLATAVVVHCYVPVFFKLGTTSAFEYLEKRYGRSTRLLASIAFTIQLILYTSVVLYAPALAMEATTGITTATSIIGIGIVCTFYSTLGGIKAVLITDVFQSILMFFAILTVIVTAAVQVGGLDEIWRIAEKGERVEFDNISVDPTVRHTWWSLTIGGFFTYVYLFGTNQVQVQKLLTVRNLGAAQRTLWWCLPITIIMVLIMCFSGLAMYARYQGCDPHEAGRILSNDQLLPLYVMDALSDYPGVPGLFIAGMFSAGLSTISATINSLAMVVLEDYIKPVCHARKKEISPTASLLVGKVLTVLIGLCCVGLAFIGRYLGGVLQAALTIFGTVGGPMLGLYTLGMFSTSGNHRGANVGLLVGLIFCFWIGFGQPKPPIPKLPVSTVECGGVRYLATNLTTRTFEERIPGDDDSYFYLYRLSYMWYSPLGFVITFVVGWTASRIWDLFSDDEAEEIDSSLLSPIMTCFSRSQRRKNEYNSTVELADSSVRF